ncbi:uncharacterized protein FA14DRAFT_171365 [Meira miltonrushii]|uniref:Uncharacterized protein n=1 Tax=Meira miltonrushii TaxID=1280837 RepID=A0A316VAH9_9BASI|nr:uncharacterized protein FA14DRAFT_171365 [Meira miltonrushii]PWN34597.1 hypothetical protein FA14DRAFT_171365 [Meira miltonrushii]
MQAFLKVLVCAALSGALVFPQEGAALPYGLQARQISGSASGSLDGSLSAGLPDLSDSLPDLSLPTDAVPTDVATPTIPSLPTDVPSPTIPSLTTSLPDLSGTDAPQASAVFSSLSSALNALPTGDATAQTQAFETFLKNTLNSFEDVIGGNFDNIPSNLGDSGDLNTPDLPEPLSTLYDVFNNGLQSLFSALNLNVPSPALGVVSTDGSDDDTPATNADNSASADLTSAQAGSASAGLNTANARDVSADDQFATAGTAAAGPINAIARRDGYQFNFDLNNLLNELASSFNKLIDSYGVDGYETVIPTNVTDAIPSTN